MQLEMPRMLMTLALSVAASSCANRVEIRPALPPAADLAQLPEPPYPIEALEPGEAGEKAEAEWRDKVLIWGRAGWAQNRRVCLWAVELGLEVPKGYCG